MEHENFGMIIPKEAMRFEEMVEDPRGAPIYASCQANGGLCACTGACQVIIDYTKDPIKLSAHREYIARYNAFYKQGGMQQLYGKREWDSIKEITVVTNRKTPPTDL